jgi:hypothetical protein
MTGRHATGHRRGLDACAVLWYSMAMSRKHGVSMITDAPPTTTLVGAQEFYALAQAYETAGAWEAALTCYGQAYGMFADYAPQKPAVFARLARLHTRVVCRVHAA